MATTDLNQGFDSSKSQINSIKTFVEVSKSDPVKVIESDTSIMIPSSAV